MATHIFLVDADSGFTEGLTSLLHDRGLQTTVVPAGGSTIVEFSPAVPGTYVFVDHSMSHMDRGAMGQLVVDGAPNPDIFSGDPTANTAESK